MRAGIDWMSLANNHIKDYGSDGIADTRKNLDRYGIKYAGAGKNLKQAREYSILDGQGRPGRAHLLHRRSSAPNSYATDGSAGAMPCKQGAHRGAASGTPERRRTCVIVFPHWGAEYNRSPVGNQRALAASVGADRARTWCSVRTATSPGAIEEIDGTPDLLLPGQLHLRPELARPRPWRASSLEVDLPRRSARPAAAAPVPVARPGAAQLPGSRQGRRQGADEGRPSRVVHRLVSAPRRSMARSRGRAGRGPAPGGRRSCCRSPRVPLRTDLRGHGPDDAAIGRDGPAAGCTRPLGFWLGPVDDEALRVEAVASLRAGRRGATATPRHPDPGRRARAAPRAGARPRGGRPAADGRLPRRRAGAGRHATWPRCAPRRW